MSMELDDRLKSIHSKLQQVLKQYHLSQKENALLKKALNQSQQEVADKNAQLQALQQQVDAMKLGLSGWNETEKAEMEKRIDVYLKEIDKCIALLNN